MACQRCKDAQIPDYPEITVDNGFHRVCLFKCHFCHELYHENKLPIVLIPCRYGLNQKRIGGHPECYEKYLIDSILRSPKTDDLKELKKIKEIIKDNPVQNQLLSKIIEEYKIKAKMDVRPEDIKYLEAKINELYTGRVMTDWEGFSCEARLLRRAIEELVFYKTKCDPDTFTLKDARKDELDKISVLDFYYGS